MAEQPSARVVGVGHPTEVCSGDIRDAVVFCEAFVDERIVGREQLEHAAVFADQTDEEQLRFAQHRLLELVMEVGVLADVRMDLLQVLQPEPLGREPRTQRVRTGVGQHSPHLALEHGRVRELSLSRDRQQFVVRSGSPQEERQARRQIRITDAVVLAGLHVPGRLLEAEHEMGTSQERLEGGPDSNLEAAFFRSILVEGHQSIDVTVGEISSVGPHPQPGKDRLRAGPLFVFGCRTARKDFPTARRFRHTSRVVRPGNGQIPQVRQTRKSVRSGDAGAGQRPVVRRYEILHRPLEPLDECRGHSLRTRPHEDGFGSHLDTVGVGRVHPSVDIEESHPFAIDGDLDLLRALRGMQCRAPIAEQRAGCLVVERDPEDILAIGRKVLDDGYSAAGPVRRTLDAIRLRGPSRNPVLRFARSRFRITNGHPADCTCGAEVCVHQRRRKQLDVGDVVEVGALRIEWQIIPRINAKRE